MRHSVCSLASQRFLSNTTPKVQNHCHSSRMENTHRAAVCVRHTRLYGKDGAYSGGSWRNPISVISSSSYLSISTFYFGHLEAGSQCFKRLAAQVLLGLNVVRSLRLLELPLQLAIWEVHPASCYSTPRRSAHTKGEYWKHPPAGGCTGLCPHSYGHT